MNPKQQEDLEDQARDWIVRLASGEMSAEDLSAFKAWRSRSEHHERAFERERTFWQRLSRLEPAFEQLEQAGGNRHAGNRSRAKVTAREPDPVPPPARPVSAPQHSRGARSPSWRRVLPLAALAACLVLALFNTDLSIALLADFTSDGEGNRILTLPDDSRVTLNRNSAIRLYFDGARREVEILKGEAFFEVRPDRDRPFRVLAEGTVSEALGTAYAVRSIEGGARVAVTEGHVGVTTRGQSQATIHLREGEGVIYDSADGAADRFTLDGERTLAWRRNRVVFVERPLADALKELENYHPGRILLFGGGRSFQPVSGIVDLDRLDDGIAAVAATHGLEVFEVTPYLTVLR